MPLVQRLPERFGSEAGNTEAGVITVSRAPDAGVDGASTGTLLPFPTAAVQRAVDEAPEPGPAPDAPQPATGTAAPGRAAAPGPSTPAEVDALVRKLYDPLVRRLKAELRLDRERAGNMLDLRH